jgi:hypothetical protein
VAAVDVDAVASRTHSRPQTLMLLDESALIVEVRPLAVTV